MESEPETPVPSSYIPVIPVPADMLKQSSLPNPIDTTFDQSVHIDRYSPTNTNGATFEQGLGPVSEPSSPSPPNPLYNASLQELSAASLQYFPDLSSSPAKMNHLQGLMSSLHKIMNDQTFVMDDLRTQLDEIQDVLNRLSSKQNSLTAEERQIIQNAQTMKILAEEVIAARLTPESKMIDIPKPVEQDCQAKTQPLTISMPTPGSRAINSTETPPPTANTPPPGSTFQNGHLRHQSSTASFTSSANSDRQYTPDGEERSSRPSSVASSYQNKHKKKSRQSLRQLEPLANNKGSRSDVESNASFDRICSLLTELITDASTAVSTAPDGTQQPSAIPLPELPSLEPSESESSADSDSDDDDVAHDSNSTADDVEITAAENGVDDPFLKRLQVGTKTTYDAGVEVELEPADRFRTGFRSRLDKPTKRLSSLFMELQNTQTIQDIVPKDEPAKDKPVRRPRHSISSMSLSSTRSSRHNSVSLTNRPADSTEQLDSHGSPPESPLVTRRLQQRNSISSIRSESLQKLNTSNETSVTQKVDPELNRTVETIDGLTRDLVTVATHQNWMQTKLQKTLQFQKEQIQQIERAHSVSDAMSLTGDQRSLSRVDELHLGKFSEQHPLADLSRSLKQVAVSVGKVLANSTSNAHRGGRSKEGQKDILEATEKQTTSSNGGNAQRSSRFSRKDFSRYFQELEKIAALGGRIGIDRSDDDSSIKDDISEQSTSLHSKSGSADSAQSPNSSCRDFSATLVDEGFTPALDGFDPIQHNDGNNIKGDFSTSSSRRGSISAGPPELEDFAAQCRLLTRALVLPFVQLTHHAMTSQDSAFALSPRLGKLDSTLEIVEELDISQDNQPISPKLNPYIQKESIPTPSSPIWAPSMSIAGRDLDSILKAHGDISPDAIVKAKTFISTGLYLLHLLYWTVLFVIGTVVLDSWLAETAGQQVVRIVEQVREAIAKDGHPGRGFHTIQQPYQQGRETLFAQNSMLQERNYEAESILEHSRLQAHEDRAFEVAAGFESLKNRLSNPSTSNASNQQFKSPWSRQGSFQPTAAALSSATLTENTQESLASSAGAQGKALANAPAASNTSILRTVSWVGPRKRRSTRDMTSRVRRVSSARTLALSASLSKSETTPTVTSRKPGLRQGRPVSHWGSFGITSENPFGSSISSFSVDPQSQSLLANSDGRQQNIPRHALVRRKSF
ncbi:hypothetical protein BGX27_007292 [Mortierella sp. AM989]|nr:hypothetical protein BGX27_007292 [Mortierella sp. AM989]